MEIRDEVVWGKGMSMGIWERIGSILYHIFEYGTLPKIPTLEVLIISVTK